MSQKTYDLFKQAEPSMTMLSDPNRQQILLDLCQQPMTVNQLTDKLSLSRPAVSHHLKLLLSADLVTVKKEGTERYYSNNLKPAISLLRQLADSLEAELK